MDLIHAGLCKVHNHVIYNSLDLLKQIQAGWSQNKQMKEKEKEMRKKSQNHSPFGLRATNADWQLSTKYFLGHVPPTQRHRRNDTDATPPPPKWMESENQLIESRLGKKLLAVAVGVNPGLVAEQVVGDWLVFVAEATVEFIIGIIFLLTF